MALLDVHAVVLVVTVVVIDFIVVLYELKLIINSIAMHKIKTNVITLREKKTYFLFSLL